MRKIRHIVLGLALVLALAGLATGEGTVTETEYLLNRIKRTSLAWTASTNGWASVTTTARNGWILRAVFVPGTGATAPAADYTVTLKDSHEVDVLTGQGAGVTSNATVNIVMASTNVVPFDGPLDLIVTNCGSERTGTVDLYWED
jgi:hypothetical protein